MPVTFPERYVVASCHVERPLDDRVWAAFAAFQERRPGGVAVAALMRPPAAGTAEEDAAGRWLERAAEAAAAGPLGHHTHWTSPTHARPSGPDDPARRVAAEGAWLREQGVSATLFCGGGWYTDGRVAAACAALGYADCTPRASRPSYLAPGAPWAELGGPALVTLPGGEVLCALPSTHSAGEACRSGVGTSLPPRVHVHFHDTDLVDRRRRFAVEAALRLVGARRTAWTLTDEARAIRAGASRIAWSEVARDEPGAPR